MVSSRLSKGDPVLEIKGGHSHAGAEVCPLDETMLRAWIKGHNGVSAFAVASQFATRNPAHELRAAEIVKELTGKPVSASHQLSAKLKRAKTRADCAFEYAFDWYNRHPDPSRK